jgi:hypothetical protein
VIGLPPPKLSPVLFSPARSIDAGSLDAVVVAAAAAVDVAAAGAAVVAGASRHYSVIINIIITHAD